MYLSVKNTDSIMYGSYKKYNSDYVRIPVRNIIKKTKTTLQCAELNIYIWLIDRHLFFFLLFSTFGLDKYILYHMSK